MGNQCENVQQYPLKKGNGVGQNAKEDDAFVQLLYFNGFDCILRNNPKMKVIIYISFIFFESQFKKKNGRRTCNAHRMGTELISLWRTE